MTSTRRAFVIMPFGEKKAADGTAIDFDAVYQELFAPAIAAAGLMPHRADADRAAARSTSTCSRICSSPSLSSPT